MKNRITILFVIIFAASSFPQTRMKQKIDSLLSSSFFDTTMLAVKAYDATADRILYAKNDKMLLHPASNMKILTSAAGLVFLGPNYKFETKIFYSGTIANGILEGDLFFKGGANPDFTTAQLDSLIQQIKAKGIKKINGRILGDVSMMDSLFWRSGWMWDDDPSTDEAYLTPLTINDNGIKIIVSKLDGEISVSTLPQVSFLEFKNDLTNNADSSTKLIVTRDWVNRNNTIIVKGNLGKNFKTDTTTINLFAPEKYFLQLTKERFNTAGISVGGDVAFAKVPIYAAPFLTHEIYFDDVIDNLNKQSDNLSAELTLSALALKLGDEPATAKDGIKAIDSLLQLAGFDSKNYRFADGSGVSHYNLVSAELLCGVLKYMHQSQPELCNILIRSFPIAGVDGTLERRMRNTAAENNVKAKTGTLSGVSNLSGFVTAKNGHQIIFSILTQNQTRKTSRVVEYQNKICEMLAGYDE